MGSIVRLIIVFGKFAITIIIVALIVYLTVWLINKVVQLSAEYLGYEIKDFFVWVREKLPKRKENESIK